jgi:histidyl-tRNA synthetase
VALDKLDKIGQAGVVKELTEKGFSAEAIAGFEKMVDLKGDYSEKLKQLETLGQTSAIAQEGIDELRMILENAQTLGLNTQIELDITLARGLDYYTGSIFEVKASGVDIGSVGGGGRYNDLTSIFGKKDLPGVGISFGLDRIQLCLEELNLFPSLSAHSTQLLITNFGPKEALHGLQLAQKLRKLNVKTELYPDAVKLKKQLDYANKNEIDYVLLVGEKEIEEGLYLLKDMKSGEQKELSQIEILEQFNQQDQNSYGLH